MSEFKEGRSIDDVCTALAETGVDRLVQFAKACEVGERYDDMLAAVKCLAKTLASQAMTIEQRNLFSVAFKNVVGSKRASWRVLDSIGRGAADSESKAAATYQTDLEDELRKVCEQLLSLVAARIESGGEDDSGKIFFMKMAGDYNRYMAELEAHKADPITKYSAQALSEYEKAYALASEKMPATNPIRLGLALNFSVFHYEIQGQPKEACALAKDAFDAAIAKLDELSEDEYKDSTLIMQLIRDNLTLWNSEREGGVEPENDGTVVQDLED